MRPDRIQNNYSYLSIIFYQVCKNLIMWVPVLTYLDWALRLVCPGERHQTCFFENTAAVSGTNGPVSVYAMVLMRAQGPFGRFRK